MRPVLVRLHRWFGIGTALFLFVAGLTGALIAWDHELDAMLNPTFFYARSDARPLPSLELARRVEAGDPRLEVTYLPLSVEPGHALQMMVLPRVDPKTNQPYKLDFNQIAVDPATGAIQSRREWGALSIARLNLMPFIYKLHYTLFLPFTGGIDIGTWLMGMVGIVWIFDSVIALVLSFPSMKAWKKSFAFRVRRGGYALTFDLHRSGGVWIWGLLLMMAVTSVSMNLSAPVVQPVVKFFSTLTPTPFTDPSLLPNAKPNEAPIAREAILKKAVQARADKHIEAPPGAIYYAPMFHVYGIGYFGAGDDHGDGGLGNAWTYWNAQNGQPLGAQIPGRGTAGDLFMQAQFPLHSGRILGTGGRILISCVGVMVAVLSATGLLIWLKKMNARRQASSARKTKTRVVQTQTESAASR
ncbi:PepSY-associated TM helix domain-containing protein [Paraburkholderia caribensis]|uniref:PepSY-associated TM helix domain-containing protein n=1 Tax=Paraburkholderia caribensis TaxID=75105 RepID=A0A9Q6RZR6_9BURK|nr:PepSY-associated TM helix domain-containing protein [Paraburkholderia caribensis]MCO4875483.1 PepSY domain-containing protein [Paraburkholderia caribensis]PTB30589.1 peptidase [Paraburkholderia caribensis]QLB62170.1 peptidase [Paraburkholderia caribensis]